MKFRAFLLILALSFVQNQDAAISKKHNVNPKASNTLVTQPTENPINSTETAKNGLENHNPAKADNNPQRDNHKDNIYPARTAPKNEENSKFADRGKGVRKILGKGAIQRKEKRKEKRKGDKKVKEKGRQKHENERAKAYRELLKICKKNPSKRVWYRFYFADCWAVTGMKGKRPKKTKHPKKTKVPKKTGVPKTTEVSKKNMTLGNTFPIETPSETNAQTVIQFLAKTLDWLEGQSNKAANGTNQMSPYLDDLKRYILTVKKTVSDDLELGSSAADFKNELNYINASVAQLRLAVKEFDKKLDTYLGKEAQIKSRKRELLGHFEKMRKQLKDKNEELFVYERIVEFLKEAKNVTDQTVQEFSVTDETKETLRNVIEKSSADGETVGSSYRNNGQEYKIAYPDPAFEFFENSNNPVKRFLQHASIIRACVLSLLPKKECHDIPSQADHLQNELGMTVSFVKKVADKARDILH